MKLLPYTITSFGKVTVKKLNKYLIFCSIVKEKISKNNT